MPPEPIPKVVLCADDDKNLLRMIRLYLESHGYVVLTESNGRAALRTATTVHPLYALVLDYEMPDISGGEVCATLRQSKPELPIIMFSGSCDTIPVEVLRGVDVALSKDEGMSALLAALDRVTTLPRLKLPQRRRFPRYAADWPILVEVTRSGSTATLHGNAITFGEGGLGGKVEGEVFPGELVSIVISDPRLASLKPRAQIRYRRGNLYGFEFVDLSPPQQQAILRSCDQLASGGH